MLTLLNLLSAVALLVWGTHIVRTGVMRVFGARLRTVLSRSVEKSRSPFARGSALPHWYRAVMPPPCW
ncbi:sodium (Na+) symporter [Escherichia coli DEC4C]|nr:sodium (Na+) symporter [Escherichia coli DEC4A]EHV00377.1 sodium (Na+) symporter [Escherichia coli DEC4C]EHV16281.1 sodium (Na+) symporter [Escherichia coli DEC4F]